MSFCCFRPESYTSDCSLTRLLIYDDLPTLRGDHTPVRLRKISIACWPLSVPSVRDSAHLRAYRTDLGGTICG